jgi:hypothetical protein
MNAIKLEPKSVYKFIVLIFIISEFSFIIVEFLFLRFNLTVSLASNKLEEFGSPVKKTETIQSLPLLYLILLVKSQAEKAYKYIYIIIK